MGAVALLAGSALLLGACGGGPADRGAEGTEGPTATDAGPGRAEERRHHVRLDPLNGSGAEGGGVLSVAGSTVGVRLTAMGLEPRQEHVQHVHRLEGGQAGRCPSRAADEDGDGRVSLEEALPAYGPVALKLDPFPRADGEGRVIFSGSFELEPGIEPLTDRVIVVYGMDVGGVYDPTVPVACGRIG